MIIKEIDAHAAYWDVARLTEILDKVAKLTENNLFADVTEARRHYLRDVRWLLARMQFMQEWIDDLETT